MSALLEFANRHMTFAWVALIEFGLLAWCAIAALENVALGRLKVRAFEAEKRTRNKPDGAP